MQYMAGLVWQYKKKHINFSELPNRLDIAGASLQQVAVTHIPLFLLRVFCFVLCNFFQ